MSDILKIGQNTYSRIENGVTAFKDVYKTIIEDKYHLTTGWLSGADVPMFQKYYTVTGVISESIPRNNRGRLKEENIISTHKSMKTKEELLAMSHEELANYTVEVQIKASMYDAVEQKNSRMKELLAAVGIVYETYKREQNV
jgi:hypothetical protein